MCCAGIKRQAADAFSSLPTVCSKVSELNDEMAVLHYSPETFGTVDSVEIERKEKETGDFSTPN